MEALRAAMRTAGTEAETAIDAATLAADRFDAALAEDETGGPAAALDETAAAAGRAGGALQSAADVARQSWDVARAAVERTQEIARGLADDITGPIKEALKSGELSWQTFASAISGIARNVTVWFGGVSSSRTATRTCIVFRAITSLAAQVWPGASSKMETAAAPKVGAGQVMEKRSRKQSANRIVRGERVRGEASK